MPARETAHEIDAAAVDWTAKAGRGLADAEQAELDAWLAGDTRRLGAFVRAQAAWIHSERAVALGMTPEALAPSSPGAPVGAPAKAKQPSRRIVLAGGGAMAASVVTVSVTSKARIHVIDSGVGQLRRLSLADGSKLMLDAETRIEMSGKSGAQQLKLVSGGLFVDAKRSPATLFRIGVRDLVMQTVEGSFGVQLFSGMPLSVIVTAGRLAVSQSSGFFEPAREVDLEQGHTLSLALGVSLLDGVVRPLESDERDRLLAWRDGMVSFGGEALAQAARAFDRYSKVRIFIDDPDLAAQPVTGLFAANDPKGFAAAIASSFGAIVVTDGHTLRILKKVPAT